MRRQRESGIRIWDTLDYWVARASGIEFKTAREAALALDGQMAPCIFKTAQGTLRIAREDVISAWRPSSDWTIGGDIIGRERIGIIPAGIDWKAYATGDMDATSYGVDPLIAAMRAFVVSKFGKEVPDENIFIQGL
ncbi:DUF2591 domain-containing protein [Paraburkholderia acidisoli]|uniref:DUF2591 domain-containing protein n=1 Tax=Paraburkholderia acidisoli TaxID=2571748 RepID=A0A7Z2GRH8_9BURK|nr:DUF2591 domain-containing protein [Paraburkholderia acidisoli]